MVDGVRSMDRIAIRNVQSTYCIQFKYKRAPIEKPAFRVLRPLEITHTDMTEKISGTSLGGTHYFVVFLDYYTALSAVYFIKIKLQFINCLRSYKALTENDSTQDPTIRSIAIRDQQAVARRSLEARINEATKQGRDNRDTY